MSLKFRSVLVLVVGTVLGFTLSLGSSVLADRQTKAEQTDLLPVDDVRLLVEVLERVKIDYVENVDDEELIENAIRGLVSSLDPHSAFLDQEEYREIRISTTGSYSGVGLEVSSNEGRIEVISAIENTPASAAGILPGDIILTIDDLPVKSDNLDEAIKKMRGPPGSRVSLGLERPPEGEVINLDLGREVIQVASVSHELLEPRYGYVRITHFSETTGRELRAAIAKLQAESSDRLQGLVLDLRNNPGGVLDAAVEVSDAFLEEGTIVTADGRVRESRFRMDAREGDLLDGADLVVLVNSGSASASEIVAGALQDHGRATIVGGTTYGKGSVQTVMPLSNGRAIKLTTSRYYTPSGSSIHEHGITPDVEVRRELTDSTVITPRRPSPENDRDMQLALETLKEKSPIVQSKAE